MIPKFKDILQNDELEPEKLRDALKTLNENVHHQVSTTGQTKSNDILYDIRKRLTR